MNSIGGIFASWENTSAKPIRSTNTAWTSAVITSQEFEAAPGIEYTTGAPIVGTDGGGAMPGNVTVAVRWITALRGRSYRGRTFHIGLTRTACSQDILLPTNAGFLKSCYDALIAALAAESFQLVVASYRHENAPRATGLASPIVTSVVEGTLDSQRRRLSGRGM